MPKTTFVYRIFIASPSDVNEERNIVRSIVDEINTNNNIKNIKLNVIGWEDSTFPSIGEDAQDVINGQINDDYDILLGILWSRMGTPTKRDISGTKEEFERAYNRFLIDKQSINIMMYFKNAPIPISEINVNQIENIQKFQKEIHGKGVLTASFNQPEEFSNLLRNHLSQLLNKIATNLEKSINESAQTGSLISLEKELIKLEDEEYGLFEYIEFGVKDINKMSQELSKLVKQIEDLGNRLTKKTARINSLKTKSPDTVKRETKKIIDESSNDLDIFNRNVPPLMPIINELFNNSMKSFSKAILIHRDFIKNDKEQEELLESLLGLRDAIKDAYEGISELNNGIKSLPPFTTKLLKSRNESFRVMTTITDEFSSYLNVMDNIINTNF
jgi:methyl-accepting chemotaxis protein